MSEWPAARTLPVLRCNEISQPHDVKGQERHFKCAAATSVFTQHQTFHCVALSESAGPRRDSCTAQKSRNNLREHAQISTSIEVTLGSGPFAPRPPVSWSLLRGHRVPLVSLPFGQKVYAERIDDRRRRDVRPPVHGATGSRHGRKPLFGSHGTPFQRKRLAFELGAERRSPPHRTTRSGTVLIVRAPSSL